jgi:hypothetical protein
LIRTLVVLTLSAFTTLTALPVSGAKEETKRVDAADAEREAREAAEAFRDYTVEQKDLAVQAARRALADLDEQMAKWSRDMDRNWAQLNETARRNARDALESLREERQQTEEWFNELKQSSRHAWEDAKLDFARSYKSFRDKLSRAQDETL